MLTLQYRLRPGRVVAGFVVAAVMIYGGSLVLQVIGALYDHDHIFGLLPLLHVDREGNLAAWLSTITLMASGAVAWAVAENPGPMMRASTIAWRITALVLFAMSIDEAAQLHEWVGGRVQPFLPSWGPLYFGWVAVGALVVFGTLPFFVRFVRSLPRRTRLQVSTAAILFFSGALGGEIVAGVCMSVPEDKLS